MLKFTKVHVEYEENPVGTDAERPLFGWQFENAEGEVQTSYRIEVASAAFAAEASAKPTKNTAKPAEKADLWDSGEVLSSTQLGIPYGGKPLSSGQIAYFRVTVKNGAGETAVSGTGRFETALLSPEDWKGSWISMPVNFQGGALLLRKELAFPKGEIDRVRCYVAAIGYHELYFNGVKVGDSVLAPAVTDYTKTVEYCVYDPTPYLGERNVIGLHVGHGWLGDRKILVQINVRYKDGTTYEDHTCNCNGWWMGRSPIVSDSIYGGEVFDARILDECEGWASPGFECGWDNGWLYSFLTPAPGGKLRAATQEPIRVVSRTPVKKLKKCPESHIFVDAGRNMAGWLRITATGERGAKMTVRYAEDVKDGRINRVNLRSAANEDVYIFRGTGEEVYAPRFTYHGFRYAEIETEGKVKILSAVAEAVRSGVRRAGSFVCDDKGVNALHEMAADTEGNNLHSIMTDCPQRDERLGWLNDLSSRIFQTVNNYSMERFFPKIVHDITDTQNEKGEIADTAPFYTGLRPADPVSVCYLLFALACVRLYGDTRTVRTEYSALKAWTDSLLAKQKDFILNYTYYNDWVAPAAFDDVRTDGVFVSSAYLYWHLRCMAQIAGIAGKTRDKGHYSSLAAQSKRALRAKYYKDGKFANGTQCENSIALWLGLCPAADRKKLAASVAADIRAHGNHCTCGNQGYRHLFYALGEAGYNDLLTQMLLNPEYPGWGYMLVQGATSVWERWEKEMGSEMHSFNHPMFGSYDGWLFNVVAGINVAPDAIGADKLVISPRPAARMGKIFARIETLRGTVSVGYTPLKKGGRYEITVPANTSAQIILPARILSVGGKRQDKPAKKLSVGSGRYVIITA